MSARRQIIAALSEDSYGGIATLQDVEHAEQMVDAHRAEVLEEGASLLRERAAKYPSRRVFAAGLRHGALILVKAAMGKSTATSGDATPFFQPGHTYTDGDGYRAPELTTLFRVEHVTRHPDRGHLRAIGWSRTGEPDAKWHGDFRDEGEFDGWTDVTEAGEPA